MAGWSNKSFVVPTLPTAHPNRSSISPCVQSAGRALLTRHWDCHRCRNARGSRNRRSHSGYARCWSGCGCTAHGFTTSWGSTLSRPSSTRVSGSLSTLSPRAGDSLRRRCTRSQVRSAAARPREWWRARFCVPRARRLKISREGSIRAPGIEPRASAYRLHEVRQLRLVQFAVDAETTANVDTERTHLLDTLANVVRVETAGEKNRHIYFVSDPSAHRPIVSATGSTEFLDGERWLS